MTTQEGLPALARDDEISELRNYIEGATEPFRGNGKYLFASGLSRVLARLEAAQRSLSAADEFFAFDRDYTSLPADEFYAKYPQYAPDSASKVRSELRRAYKEARAALEDKSHDD